MAEAKPKKVYMTTINMFIDMVNKKFQPLIQEAELADSVSRQNVKEQVIDDLGIRGLLEKKSTLELALKDVNEQLKGMFSNERRWNESGKIDKLTQSRMESIGLTCKVRRQRDEICDKIRMSILTDDMRDALDNVNDTVTQLTAELNEFKALHAKELKALETNTEEE